MAEERGSDRGTILSAGVGRRESARQVHPLYVPLSASEIDLVILVPLASLLSRRRGSPAL